MKGQNATTRERSLLKHLGNVSKMMVYNYSLDNLTEFVLHDLCSENGFNIHKAAYFVNNPDFECLRGVAGYARPEAYEQNHWGTMQDFSHHMQRSEFNQLVRTDQYLHFDKGAQSEKERVEELCHVLRLDNPLYHVWDLKHDNHGLFLYELDANDMYVDEHLFDYLHILGHCPIF